MREGNKLLFQDIIVLWGHCGLLGTDAVSE